MADLVGGYAPRLEAASLLAGLPVDHRSRRTTLEYYNPAGTRAQFGKRTLGSARVEGAKNERFE